METPHVVGPRVELVAVEPAFPFAVLGAGAAFGQLPDIVFGFLHVVGGFGEVLCAYGVESPEQFAAPEVHQPRRSDLKQDEIVVEATPVGADFRREGVGVLP